MSPLDDKRRFGPLPYVLGGLLGVSLGLIIISGIFFYRSSVSDEGERRRTQVAPAPAGVTIENGRRDAIVVATEKVSPAVVSITSKQTRVYRNRLRSPFARQWLEFFGIPETYQREVVSLGSGVIVEEDGYILTNEHVIHNAEAIEVTLHDGRTVPASIVATTPDYDLALVKIEGNGWPKAALGDSDDLRVGEWAIAIGQPFGQLLYDTQPTVTVGVISALHRDIKEDSNSDKIFMDMIQTDAAINPGNSGGPLVNSRGEVIGINTFIFAASGGGNLGMGFAIPVNRGKWVLQEIQRYGRVREPWIGLRVSELTPELAVALDLAGSQGLLVREIDDESPAFKSGMRAGDLIVSIDGARVATVRGANRLIYGARVGDELTFEVSRKGKQKQIVVQLEEQPEEI